METRPDSPQGVEDFLKRNAPDLSIQQRRGLEATVHGAVSAYLREMRNRAEEQRERQRKMIIDTAPALHGTALMPKPPTVKIKEPASQPTLGPRCSPEPRQSTADSLTWRSQTPYTASDRELQAFRHAQNPRKPAPPTSPPLCPTTVRPATSLGIYHGEVSPSPPPPRERQAARRPQTARSLRWAKEPPKASVPLTHRPKTATAQLTTPRFRESQPAAFRMSDNAEGSVREEYVPGLKAWIDGASDYERSVVFNVMKVLESGKKDGMEGVASQADIVAEPYSAYRIPTRYGRRTRPVTPLEVYVPNAKTDSRQYFGGYDDNFRKSQKAQLANSKDYIHERSCFTNATPAFRAHFDIHPDWVSEHKSNRTQTTRSSQNGLRYGAKQ